MLNYMDRQMIATMRPAMQVDIKELKLATNFGRLMAIFLWIYGAMSSLSGLIADRVNRKWLIIGSLFIWSAVTAAMGFAQNFNQLYWLRAVMGFSEALYFPAGLALIADYHSNKTRSLAIGIHLSGVYMGQALGGFGSTAADLFSWQSTFMSFGLIGIAYAFILILFLRDQPAVKKTSSQSSSLSVFKSLGSFFGSFSFWVIILYFAVPSLPGWAIKNWAPTLISDHLNIEMSVAGPLATISIQFHPLWV